MIYSFSPPKNRGLCTILRTEAGGQEELLSAETASKTNDDDDDGGDDDDDDDDDEKNMSQHLKRKVYCNNSHWLSKDSPPSESISAAKKSTPHLSNHVAYYDAASLYPTSGESHLSSQCKKSNASSQQRNNTNLNLSTTAGKSRRLSTRKKFFPPPSFPFPPFLSFPSLFGKEKEKEGKRRGKGRRMLKTENSVMFFRARRHAHWYGISVCQGFLHVASAEKRKEM